MALWQKEPFMANADTPHSSVRILLVDDYEPWRRRIRSTLEARLELQVVGEASDGLEAILKAQELQPDLILLDIGLPTLNGIEAATRIHKVARSAKILFASMINDLEVVGVALSNGAKGYLLKTDAWSELMPAIEAVVRGDRFLSAGLKAHTLEATVRTS
jgi:DNA-binding NarL/FixJ family response regulator